MDLENYRSVFVLHVHGLNNSAIAKRLGCSREWVRQTLARLDYLPRKSFGRHYSGSIYPKLSFDQRAPNPGKRDDAKKIIMERGEWKVADLLPHLEYRGVLVSYASLTGLLRECEFEYDRRTGSWSLPKKAKKARKK